MNPLLEQFVPEAREALLAIGDLLVELERAPEDGGRITELFRLVHTLKGNTGLFDFPEMTRVLHAGEDLMDAIREGRVAFTPVLADRLLAAMDFVGALVDEVAQGGPIRPGHAGPAEELARSLRAGLPADAAAGAAGTGGGRAPALQAGPLPDLQAIPESTRKEALGRIRAGGALFHVCYQPEPDCFFKGEDPLLRVRSTPGLLWGQVQAAGPWPPPAELDCYRCQLAFQVLSSASREELDGHFRYVPEQVEIRAVPASALESPRAIENGDPVPGDSVAAATEPAGAELESLLDRVLEVQEASLALPGDGPGAAGRLQACAATLKGCLARSGIEPGGLPPIPAEAGGGGTAEALRQWLAAFRTALRARRHPAEAAAPVRAPEPGFGRRAEDAQVGRILKVDQAKVDRLMDLIGEMVVAKNSLPYLAIRAETRYGSRELGREIKAEYAVINRIAEEMQEAIMQVRMMPVGSLLQRFPRLVRDLSRRLDKEVELVLEGEATEADKSVLEALADPLLHLVRNSLDHGLEPPGERARAGKAPMGRLTIRASQESDRVLLQVSDDGRGMDPGLIRRKVLERGLVEPERLDRMGPQEVLALVFLPGFSTAEKVSDLSGRGVGMDVVRHALDRVGGTVDLTSEPGLGTTVRMTLPPSMAVSNVMIVESDQQTFGIPMGAVVETVRLARASIHQVKHRCTTLLRRRIVPLLALNQLLGLPAEPRPDADGELAVLVVRHGGEQVGLLVDRFCGVADVILKPLPGSLAGLAGYAGTALLGDGTVLMVLNPKELIR